MIFLQIAAFAQNSEILINTTIKELRENKMISYSARYYTTNLGQEGNWYYDATDITSDDNTGTVIVNSNGKRFKRIHDGKLNVKWFGAIGDGIANESTACKNALKAAAMYSYSYSFGSLPTQSESGSATLFFPAGIYLISENKAFTNIGLTGRIQGIKITGAGNQKTRIRIAANNWLFDNYGGTPAKSWTHLTFEDITFEGADKTTSSFMRIWSDGQADKEHSFISCYFTNLNIVLATEGAANADHTSWTNCFFERIWTNILALNNVESVIHQFKSCNILGTYCTAIFKTTGGGYVSYVGGSIINGYSAANPSAYNEYRTVDQYVLEIDGVTEGNNRFTFTDVRFEMPSNLAKLVNIVNDNGTSSRTTFTNCGFAGVLGGNREVIRIQGENLIEFINCALPTSTDNFLYRIRTNTAAGYRSIVPTINFKNCEIPVFNSAKVIFEYTDGSGLQNGKITAEGCFKQFPNAGGNVFSPRYAMDFTYPNKSGYALSDFAPKLHRVVLHSSTHAWPYKDLIYSANEKTVILPDGATIINIILIKEAEGINATSYQLKVGNSDKTIIYGSSVSGRYDAEHKILVKDLFVNVGTDINKKTIRLWSNPIGASTPNYKGFAIIEYY